MKVVVAGLVAGSAWAAPILWAQDFVAPLPEPREMEPLEVQESRPSIEGILRDIFVIRKPWQLVNPAAPQEAGSGERRVNKDFGPGTPVHAQGVVLLGIEW